MELKSKTLCVAVARASKVVNGPTKVGKLKPGIGSGELDAQGREVFGAALLGDRRFHVGQQRGARFERPRLRLLQRFARRVECWRCLRVKRRFAPRA